MVPPDQFQVIEPSAFVDGESIRVLPFTLASILATVAVMFPFALLTTIAPTLVTAASATPKLFWISVIDGQFGQAAPSVS